MSDSSTPPDHYEIYVDGSFEDDAVGYGVVILRNGQVAEELCGAAQTDPAHRQVGGEIKAVLEALQWCQAHAVKAATIYYDYMGLQAWATGQWKATKPLTQQYAAAVRAAPIALTWRKVTSHSGVRWNERADQLARQGAASQGVSSAPTTPAATEQVGRMAALTEKAHAFIAHLAAQGIQAEFKGIFNGMYARIAALGGLFDLYNTARKPFHTYLHSFNRAADKARLEAAWEAFRTQR